MRKLFGFVLGMILGLMIYGNQPAVVDDIVVNEVNEEVVISAELTHKEDGGIFVKYSTEERPCVCFALIDEEQGMYELYCPELWGQDALECKSIEDLNDTLMYLLDMEVGMNRTVVQVNN